MMKGKTEGRREMEEEERREGREAQQEGDISVIVADLLCCMAEINTTL